MKMNREQLKELIKECLVEILTEGIGTSNRKAFTEVYQSPKGARKSTQQTINRIPTVALQEAVKREAHGNPVLADILTDTAVKTLPNMLANETRSQATNSGVAEQIVANTTPDQLFGKESALKWANLAFSDSFKK